MKDLTDLSAISLLFLFVIPGFVSFQSLKIICPSIGRSNKDFYLAFVTLSGLNFAMFGFLIPVIDDRGYDVYLRRAVWSLFIFVLPLVEGVIIGGLIQNNDLQKFLRTRMFRWTGIRATSFGVSAWDALFSNISARYAIVTLKDGSMFKAALGEMAHMSADLNERDIYFDHLFEADADETWRRVPKSLYVSKDQIRTIEFFDPV